MASLEYIRSGHYLCITGDDVLNNVNGRVLRLQPLIRLDDGSLYGHEVLSAMYSGCPGKTLSQLTTTQALQLFMRQCHALKGRPGRFSLNLPCSVFRCPDAVIALQTFSHQPDLIIEIQDPENLQCNPEQVFIGARKLSRTGWKIWLDDWTAQYEQSIDLQNDLFDAIKIDRGELAKPGLKILIDSLLSTNQRVIVEGIECPADLERLPKRKGIIGQGFLWPEKQLVVLSA